MSFKRVRHLPGTEFEGTAPALPLIPPPPFPLSPAAEAPEYGLWSEGEFSLAPRRYLSSLAESIDWAWLSEVADQTQAPTA